MSEKTAVSWTATYQPDGTVTPGSTWNPVSGCSHKSDGCSFCYAEALSLRFGWSKKPWTAANARENVVLHPERLRHPYSWRQPRKVFVCSMADLFHELVPDSFIAQVFEVMNALPQHTFQVLTKRTTRLASWPGPWTPNIWAGGTVENRKAISRIDEVRRCGAAVHYLSFEPLLEDLGPLDLRGIEWAIIGGESGKHIKSRPDRQMDHAWARSIRDQCVAASVAVWFKQSSGVRSETGTELIEADGSRTLWRQFPDVSPVVTVVPEQSSMFGVVSEEWSEHARNASTTGDGSGISEMPAEKLRQPTTRELEAYRASLPSCDQRDEFSLLSLWWDVVKARWILAHWPRSTQPLNVLAWSKGHGYDQLLAHPEPEYGPSDEQGFREIKMPFVLVDIDPKQAMRDEIDLSQAVIVAEVILPNGQQTQILLDGHKRLFKALARGLQTIPAFLLSREEAELCRLR